MTDSLREIGLTLTRQERANQKELRAKKLELGQLTKHNNGKRSDEAAAVVEEIRRLMRVQGKIAETRQLLNKKLSS